jgi:hypothetical protein
MADTKLTRELETRAVQKRLQRWAPAELLPEPDKQAGFEYHWKRVALNNNADPRNISASFREGWEPVLLSEQPKFQLLADPNSKFKDNIEIGGLLLCKRPEEFGKQEREYYAEQTKRQTEAVDNNLMRQSDARMPIFQERRSSTTFGRGS